MRKLLSLNALLLCSVLFVSFLSSCKQSNKSFIVKGEITSADNKTLFFEHRGLGGIEIIDSIKLKENGKFQFKENAADNPEFYQLRIDNQRIVIAVDSAETLILKADASNLYKTYAIEGSNLNMQIKKVIEMQKNAENSIFELQKLHKGKTIDDASYLSSVDSVLVQYKEYATNLILGNPSSAAAYYAVFQKINDYLIFNPYDKKDYPMFGAVATSWDRYFPNTSRTKHLYDFTLNALRERKQYERQNEFLSNMNIEETQLPDISLQNVNGKKINLSSLKGQLVILDFTAYKSEFSLNHNTILENVYGKFKSKGLEIYQISFDSDSHFWKNAAVEFPWITVRDQNSINSNILKDYNIRELPTAYILNRDGDLIKRIDDFSLLEKEINEVI